MPANERGKIDDILQPLRLQDIAIHHPNLTTALRSLPAMASKLAPWAFRSSARALRTASRQQRRQFQVSAAPRSESLFVVCPHHTPRPPEPPY